MPPSMNGDQDGTVELHRDHVSDEAITLLYEVIERAQTAPDLTAFSRTLFDIYNEVLAERGIQTEDDTVRHELVTRLTSNSRQDEGLMQRFQRVMGDLGIVMEHNEDGEGYEFTSELHGTSTGSQHALRPTPARRGSLDSLLDGSADKIAGTVDVGHDLGNAKTEGWQKRRALSDTDANGYAPVKSQLPHRIRSVATAYQSRPLASQQYKPGSLRIRRNGVTDTAHLGDSDADDSEHTEGSASFDLAKVYMPGVNAPIPESRQEPPQQYGMEPFRPSDTRLMDDAETFEQQRLHSLVRSCILMWRERTREQMRRNEEMMRVAVQYDRRILLGGALPTLLRESQKRRSIHDTDHFFRRLEDRADRARNLFLLTKAFTHWARSAEDEVQRTSVARRHILRTRFFNGWREITAVNELKIQHFVLGKFLDKWRRRTAEVRERQELALQVYNDNLQRKYYKDWFFKFCEIAAPAWHNARLDPRLKRATFQQWHEAAVVWTDQNAWATDRRNGQMQRSLMEVWRQKTATVRALESQAEGFRRRNLLTTALAAVQRHARFSPILSHFQTTANRQRLQSTLQMWRQTTNFTQQAKNVDRLRVQRNAWTAWNDRLRIMALEERINDRVLVENMYKWTLASRVSLFQRVHDRSLKENVFLTWREKTQDQHASLEIAERRFARFKRAQLLRSCLQKIETAIGDIRAETAAVTVQYDLKLKQRIFDKLLDKHDHFQRLNRWARDAQFYVLTTHTLKTWTDATQIARRNRRREAYAQVRRTVKTRLARRTFGVWRQKADAIAEQQHQADEMGFTRTLQNSQTLFTHWQDRTIDQAARNAQAVQHYNHKVQVRFLSTSKQRLATLENMEIRALEFCQIGIEVTAVTLLKKLGWEGTKVQFQNTSAVALHERHFKKHISAMIMFWLQQARERITARSVSPTPTSRSRGRRSHDEDEDGMDDDHGHEERDGGVAEESERPFDDDAGDETRRLEGWTEFDQNALDLSFSLSPQHQPPPRALAPPSSSSSSRPVPARPQTYPQPPRSALRSRPVPPPLLEDLSFDEPDATSTPMPLHLRAGYLKTPSKRSVVRNKRSEILGSPEKRVGRLGAMSAPPAAGMRDVGGVGQAELTSFMKKLREGGYGEQEKRKGRVEFGDVQRFG